MSQAPPPVRVQIAAEEPSAEDYFYRDVGQKLVRDELPLLRDALGRLVTLDAALIGAAIALFRDLPAHPWLKVATLVLLAVSLASALFGVLPARQPLHWNYPDLVREAVTRSAEARSACLTISALFLFAAALAAVAAALLPANW